MRERPSRSHPAEGVLIFRDQPTIVFATICSRKRRSHLANDSVHNALVESWRASRAWLVGFYLIMPDHIHLFCAPQSEQHTLEEWVSFCKRRLRRQLKTFEALFQAHSFHHRLRRDESYSEKWDYVRMNPLRAGLVSDRAGTTATMTMGAATATLITADITTHLTTPITAIYPPTEVRHSRQPCLSGGKRPRIVCGAFVEGRDRGAVASISGA